MKKILFVCLGNICRSPMAEFILKAMLPEGTGILVDSAAISDEEYGNPIYPPVRRKLEEKGIAFDRCKTARSMVPDDYGRYDMIVVMERRHKKEVMRITGGDPDGKISTLMAYTMTPDRDIADPWYTGDFEKAFNDIRSGCEGLLQMVMQ